ncbi:acyltransferase family protein [Streptomyces sp. NBC_01304]|uniref:acyltransferase family protein n=1 Tax=Streptomyces sp. NBC_01304 TaxID=2903818 RepID=UPI002E13C901|nr:acyltransferase [Streptomyces sp. NBC_01304]
MKFRTDIEGLRAVAVLAVVGFHVGIPYFAGGYTGVDVFFVISGFLITGLLLKEIRETGRVRIANFYARRARRILPSAAVVLIVTLAASWLILPPLRRPDVAWDAITSAFSAANWRFIAHNTDYMAAGQSQSPLLHFWSLAVEEQFYLLLAPLLWLLARTFKRLIGPVLVLVTAASFVLSLYWTQLNQPLAYMASPTRAWQFGLGGLLALVAWAPRGKLTSHALGVLGGGAIIASVVLFTSKTPFPGWAAALPTLGAVAVIAAGPSGVVGRLLSAKPMRRLGQLSFAWYLWHFPVLTLADAWAGQLSWPVKAVVAVAALLPAWLTMKFVEQPLRYARALKDGARPSLNLGLAATVFPVVIALAVGSGSLREMTTDLTNLQLVGAKSGSHLITDPVGGPVPSPLKASADYPKSGDCEVRPDGTTSPACLFGDTGAKGRVVLFGDSHADEWFPVAKDIARQHDWALEDLTKMGCPPAQMSVFNPQLGRTYTECDAWRDNALKRIAAGPKPKMIIVGSLNMYGPSPQALADAWKPTLDALTATGAPVVYLRDNPKPDKDIPACVSGANDPSACDFPAAQALRPDLIADHPPKGVHVVDVDDVLCPPGTMCPAVKDGVLLYRDDSHLTNTAAALLAPRIEDQIRRLHVLK